MRLGIDFGTTRIVVAAVDRGNYPVVSFEAIQALKDFFAPRGKALTTAAVAWVLAQPGITAAIVGASRVDHLDLTLAATDATLDADELAALDEVWYRLPRRPPVPGPVR